LSGEAFFSSAEHNNVSGLPTADRTSRARKGTINLGSSLTRRLRSFLDESGEDSSWKRPKLNEHGKGLSDTADELPPLVTFERSAENILPEATVVEVESRTAGEEQEASHIVSLQPLPPILGFLVSYDRSVSG